MGGAGELVESIATCNPLVEWREDGGGMGLGCRLGEGGWGEGTGVVGWEGGCGGEVREGSVGE